MADCGAGVLGLGDGTSIDVIVSTCNPPSSLHPLFLTSAEYKLQYSSWYYRDPTSLYCGCPVQLRVDCSSSCTALNDRTVLLMKIFFFSLQNTTRRYYLVCQDVVLSTIESKSGEETIVRVLAVHTHHLRPTLCDTTDSLRLAAATQR